MINAASIKVRLKNHAKESGHTLQNELTMYGLERTIYRISISPYVAKFTLKGGIFLYALFDGNFARATTDIDLLAKDTSNDTKEIKEIFADRAMMEFPVLLNMEVPIIYAYSLDSVVAEKFEAIVQLGYGNSRYKDFYDIYILAATYDFDGNILRQAVVETFAHRNTGYNDIVAFETDFAEDVIRQSRWRAFIKKKRAMVTVEFGEVLELFRIFLEPIARAIMMGEDFELKWDCKSKCWK